MRTTTKGFSDLLNLIYDIVEFDYSMAEATRVKHGLANQFTDAEKVRISVSNIVDIIETEWESKIARRGCEPHRGCECCMTIEELFVRDWNVVE